MRWAARWITILPGARPEAKLFRCQKAGGRIVFWPIIRPFSAHLTHMQTVTRLPPGATVLASSQHDPHQIVRYGVHAVSTQFHPEITPAIARSLIAYRQAALRNEGIDPDKLSLEVEESPVASAILTRFVAGYLPPDRETA